MNNFFGVYDQKKARPAWIVKNPLMHLKAGSRDNVNNIFLPRNIIQRFFMNPGALNFLVFFFWTSWKASRTGGIDKREKATSQTNLYCGSFSGWNMATWICVKSYQLARTLPPSMYITVRYIYAVINVDCIHSLVWTGNSCIDRLTPMAYTASPNRRVHTQWWRLFKNFPVYWLFFILFWHCSFINKYMVTVLD